MMPMLLEKAIHWQGMYERERDLYDKRQAELAAAQDRIKNLEADVKALVDAAVKREKGN